MKRQKGLLVVALVSAIGASLPAHAQPRAPVEHEQIPPDPHEDIAFDVALDGDLPAAIQTKDGPLPAPDPRRPVNGSDPTTSSTGANDGSTFDPDRNTKRPDVQGYDEPFTPSTAPFKRLEAFDAVDANYELFVNDKRLQTVSPGAQPAPDGSEDQFFADLVVDIAPGRRTRIPSVGPGSRIVRARLGIGAEDLQMRVYKDGADNWFLEGYGATARARLVMELTIPRGVFGGEFADPAWSDLPKVQPLPMNVAQSAREVDAALGISSAQRPREIVSRLVTYFRGFVDSEDPPRGRRDIYLDLALSKKGVCRHRAFAFMITALSLGIPARMVINEAHAWVEVNDGTLWRRLDLGGAGRMVNPASNALPERAVHQAPPDAFQWPEGSQRGDDMVAQARDRARQERDGSSPNGAADGGGASTSPRGVDGDGGTGSAVPSNGATGSSPVPSSSASSGAVTSGGAADDRPSSLVTIALADPNAHRGMPLGVRGDVKADGEPCAHVMVELYLRDPRAPERDLFLGAIATGDHGEFAGAIVVPGTIPLGDYDVVAKTHGDARCGGGGSN